MGRQNNDNTNAQRNNNAKKQEKSKSTDPEFASYAEVEVNKMNRHKQY